MKHFALQSHSVIINGEQVAACVEIKNELIYDILPHGADLSCPVQDFGDKVIMPGLVDSHVHINEPGRTEWEGFNTATQAAAAGGITALVDMPLNCIPVTTTKAAFQEKLDSVLIEKTEFGLFVLQNQRSKMLFDVGDIGPDYLPGHAHCDTLSYELSLDGKRCIVNSGTYQYAGSERNAFRSTRAHNTVQIDGLEQHEIWSTFRVARRAYPLNVSVENDNAEVVNCSASISGFKQLAGNPVHRRDVSFQQDCIIINDVIEGQGEHLAESYIHLHPDVSIFNYSNDVLQCKLGEMVFSIQALGDLEIDVEKAWFSPEFGIRTENIVLVLRKQAICPFSFGYKVVF